MFNFICFVSLFTVYTLFFVINVNWGKNWKITKKIIKSLNTWYLLLGASCVVLVLFQKNIQNCKAQNLITNVAYSIIASVIFYFIGIFPSVARKNKQNKKIKERIIEINELLDQQFENLMKALHLTNLNGTGQELQRVPENIQTLKNFLYQIDIHIDCYDIITFISDDEINCYSLVLSDLKYSVLDLMNNLDLGGVIKAPNEIDDSLIEMQELANKLHTLIEQNKI